MTSGNERDTLSGTLVVDGIEGGQARVELEDGHTEVWPLASLPRHVREGDVVRLQVEGGDLSVEIDHEATHQRRHTAQVQIEAFNRAAPTGEIEL